MKNYEEIQFLKPYYKKYKKYRHKKPRWFKRVALSNLDKFYRFISTYPKSIMELCDRVNSDIMFTVRACYENELMSDEIFNKICDLADPIINELDKYTDAIGEVGSGIYAEMIIRRFDVSMVFKRYIEDEKSYIKQIKSKYEDLKGIEELLNYCTKTFNLGKFLGIKKLLEHKDYERIRLEFNNIQDLIYE